MAASDAALGSKEQALANASRLLRSGDFASAADQAREIVNGDDRCAEAWRILGLSLRATGRDVEAHNAEITAILESELNLNVFLAVLAIADNRLDEAEKMLREHLKEQSDDAAALRLLAQIAARLGRLEAAERLLRDALRVAPEYPAAQKLLARVKIERDAQSTRQPPEFPRGLRADSVNAVDQYAEALALFERVVERFPESSRNWLIYGHILRMVGKQHEAIGAYRHAIALKPDAGEAWWAIADLKTRGLDEGDIDQLSKLINDEITDETELPRIHFALGRALEQAERFEESFHNYAEGNRLAAATNPYDARAITHHVDESIRLFTGDFFRARGSAGFDARDPIFVLGLPRAGSTLIEQILSSHSEIEGTMELPDISAIANWLAGGRQASFQDSDYLDSLAALPSAELLKLGKGYIWGTSLRRQTNKPFFIDKMPNNWLHLGLILTILPKARIIDARRHPMACGLSNFRQHFSAGHAFSYNLTTIGSFYGDYVRMMDHFDHIAPGRIIRVIHEQLTAEPEAGIRNLLDRLGLPFDEACLHFHENRRAVRTSSSEQVRQPISREGVDQWRAFEPWLGPLKQALGPIAENYPVSR